MRENWGVHLPTLDIWFACADREEALRMVSQYPPPAIAYAALWPTNHAEAHADNLHRRRQRDATMWSLGRTKQ